MAKSRRRIGNDIPTENETLPQSVGDTTTADADRERIAMRAYELYLARGGTDGMDMEDWLVAERELRNGSDESNNEER